MEGDTKMKRIQTICNLLLAVIVFISNSRVVFANSCSEHDYFLASAGVPHGPLGTVFLDLRCVPSGSFTISYCDFPRDVLQSSQAESLNFKSFLSLL